MANENTAYAVPDFKVARVGKERKKRGAGFSWFSAPAKPGAWTGVAGGSGGGYGAAGGILAKLGLTGSKAFMIIALTSGIGAGAIKIGQMGGARVSEAAMEKPTVFAKPEPIQFEGDTSNLPSTPNSMPNSLGYVSGSPDGLTPEERARLAAEAEAKKAAEEEAARKAEEEAAAKDQTAQNPMDPAAMMAAAQEQAGGKKGSPFGKKFGSLSSSFGGQSSLSGGAGLSVGVARNFVSGNLNGPRGKGGQLGSMGGVGSRVKMAGASRARVSPSNVKGFARRQLANANALSRRGMAASRGESAAYDASSAFDNNDGAGNVITGAGIGGGIGPGEGKPDTPNALNNGGPTGGGGQGEDCGGSAYFDANTGNCVPLSAPKEKSAQETIDTLFMIAQGLLMTIAVIAAIAAALDAGILTEVFSIALSTIIGALGVVVGLLGVAIIAMGDYFSGTMLTLTGAFIGAVAFVPALKGLLSETTMLLTAAIGGMLSQSSKMLDPQSK